MSDRTIVVVDFWENQTFKQINGGWSVPYYGVHKYSDATGKIHFKQEKTMTGTVFLPLGWEWLDKTWEIDKSGKFGVCDADGWSYATTFDILVENTRQRTLKDDKNPNNMMRRRRWIRNRRCTIPDVVKLHTERVDWAESIRSKIEEVQEVNMNNRTRLSEYYLNQKEAIEKVIINTDNSILDVIFEFNNITEKLLALRTFLTERGAIEETYSQKMDIFSKKWINEGDNKRYIPGPGVLQSAPYLITSDPGIDIFAAEGTAAVFWNTTTNALKTAATATTLAANNAATAANYAATAATVAVNNASANVRRLSSGDMDFNNLSDLRSNTTTDTSSTQNTNTTSNTLSNTTTIEKIDENHEKNEKNRGILDDYYYSVCLAHRTVGQRLQSYAHLLTHDLPEQVDGILDVVKEALNECRNEGREIRSALMSNCRTAEQRFSTYSQCFENSQTEMRTERQLLYACVRESSATADMPVSDPVLNSLSALTGVYGDASPAGDTAAALINRFNNIDTVDVWLAIQLYFTAATNVDSVLLMYHAFSRMQVRRLREITTTIDELLHLTLRTFSTEQFRSWEECSSALAALGAYKDILILQLRGPTGEKINTTDTASTTATPVLTRSDSQNSDFQEVGETSALTEIAAPPRSTELSPGRKSSNSTASLDNESMVNSGRNSASSFRQAFFSDLPTEAYVSYHGRLNYYACTRAEAHAGGVDYTEHSIYHEAIVVMTYDRVLHLLQVPHDVGGVSELKYTKDRLMMSVNVRNVLVRPFAIPKEGYRDAFEVLLAGSSSKKMSLLGSLSTSGKDITALIFLTHDTFQMRSWMRAISNPFTDTCKDPPDSPAPVAQPPAAQQATTTPTIFTSTTTVVSGGVPGTPDRSSERVTVDASDGFSYGGSEDIVSGTNSLRSMGPKMTAGSATKAPPATATVAPSTPAPLTAGTESVSVFSSLGDDENISGTNAMRELLRTPSSKTMKARAVSPLSPTPTTTTAAVTTPGESSGHTLGPAAENIGGVNALRRLKKTPSSMINSSTTNVLSGAAVGGGNKDTGDSSPTTTSSGTERDDEIAKVEIQDTVSL